MVFVLSPIILLLAGSIPELGEHANVELGFSLLALAGASGCVVGMISNVYRLLEAPLSIDSPFVRLPTQPGPEPGGTLREGASTAKRLFCAVERIEGEEKR